MLIDIRALSFRARRVHALEAELEEAREAAAGAEEQLDSRTYAAEMEGYATGGYATGGGYATAIALPPTCQQLYDKQYSHCASALMHTLACAHAHAHIHMPACLRGTCAALYICARAQCLLNVHTMSTLAALMAALTDPF